MCLTKLHDIFSNFVCWQNCFLFSDKKIRRKKKKTRKSQTSVGPSADASDEASASASSWAATARASRSPRLDTVQEPDNETDCKRLLNLLLL